MRPALPWSVRRRVWDRIRAGDAPEVAGPAVGVSAKAAQRWVREAGGVNPFPLTSPVGRYLSFEEREDIAVWRGQRVSMREIGRRLGRSASTISRELGKPTGQGGYRASVAQHNADQVRHRRRPERVKLLINPRLREQVEAGLDARRSPEQIAGRLVLDFPDDPEMRVSPETIYQSLYIHARGGLKQELTRHLRTGRVMRHPHRKGGERRGRIPGMVMIADRPVEADDRAVPGHWEGDLIKGSVPSNSAIGTLVERSSGLVLLLHLPDGYTADKVQAEAVRAISALPTQLRRSLTWDQGVELTNHVQIAAAAGIDIYFCDPHSPWQRGSNENTNGLLRQYFPKGTDLSVHDRATLELVTIEMNSRPRKRHGYLTPAEQLTKLLTEAQNPGVASPG